MSFFQMARMTAKASARTMMLTTMATRREMNCGSKMDMVTSLGSLPWPKNLAENVEKIAAAEGHHRFLRDRRKRSASGDRFQPIGEVGEGASDRPDQHEDALRIVRLVLS